jgi:hypothetical protein
MNLGNLNAIKLLKRPVLGSRAATPENSFTQSQSRVQTPSVHAVFGIGQSHRDVCWLDLALILGEPR